MIAKWNCLESSCTEGKEFNSCTLNCLCSRWLKSVMHGSISMTKSFKGLSIYISCILHMCEMSFPSIRNMQYVCSTNFAFLCKASIPRSYGCSNINWRDVQRKNVVNNVGMSSLTKGKEFNSCTFIVYVQCGLSL